MTYDPMRHGRRSIRLRGYDYRTAGFYFVTICTWNRECIFGDVVDGVVRLSDAGRIAEASWLTLAMHDGVECDEFVVMPNHLHGILALSGDTLALGELVRAFKARTTHAIAGPHKTGSIRVWQRKFYERIIRDDAELTDTRQYIKINPLVWSTDPENPQS